MWKKRSGLRILGVLVLFWLLAACERRSLGQIHEPTATPAPRVQGIYSPEDMQRQYDEWPDAFKFAVDEEVVVRFAFPDPLADWVGVAFVDHTPSCSSVALGHSAEILHEHYGSDEGRARTQVVLGDPKLMRRIRNRIDQTWSDAQLDLADVSQEPNDTREQATMMQVLTVTGYISHPEDVDIFRTPATYGGYLLDFSVELYDLPADYDLYVYDSADREVARSTNRGSAPEHVYYRSGPRTGNSYWLKVVGVNGSCDPDRPYHLRFAMNPGTSTPTAPNP